MEYILVLLIVALLNGAIAYIDGLMEGIIPLTLYAEQYQPFFPGEQDAARTGRQRPCHDAGNLL